MTQVAYIQRHCHQEILLTGKNKLKIKEVGQGMIRLSPMLNDQEPLPGMQSKYSPNSWLLFSGKVGLILTL
jgi:hypothetical protein